MEFSVMGVFFSHSIYVWFADKAFMVSDPRQQGETV